MKDQQRTKLSSNVFKIVLTCSILLYNFVDPFGEDDVPQSQSPFKHLEQTITQQCTFDVKIDLKNNCTIFSNNFCLNAKLYENQLYFELFDFINQQIYVRKYSQQQIGVQIHRKVDLKDIYNIINSQKNQKDNNFYYQLETIKKSSQGQSLYKIGNNGTLTFYVQVKVKNTKSETKSVLKLFNLRPFSTQQTFAIKLEIAKKQMELQMKKQVNELSKQNKILSNKLNKLEQEVLLSQEEQQNNQQIEDFYDDQLSIHSKYHSHKYQKQQNNKVHIVV